MQEEPERGPPAPNLPFGSDFQARLISAVVLAPVAVLVAWVGGWLAVVTVTCLALVIFREWNRMARGGRIDAGAMLGATGIIGVGIALALGAKLAVIGVLTLAGLGILISIAEGSPAVWLLRGAFYALLLLAASILLRDSVSLGRESIFFLFAVVWSTDVCAFFAGRLVGGPKLWPSVSPKKTWAGFIGGTLGGGLGGYVAARVMMLDDATQLILVALTLSVVAHGGDLFESALKRHFRQKDSGHIIPGHGGAMDRCDGFIAAAMMGLLIGLSRANVGDVASGLLRW